MLGQVLMPVKIFFCYAHEDEALLNQLVIYQQFGFLHTLGEGSPMRFM